VGIKKIPHLIPYPKWSFFWNWNLPRKGLFNLKDTRTHSWSYSSGQTTTTNGHRHLDSHAYPTPFHPTFGFHHYDKLHFSHYKKLQTTNWISLWFLDSLDVFHIFLSRNFLLDFWGRSLEHQLDQKDDFKNQIHIFLQVWVDKNSHLSFF